MGTEQIGKHLTFEGVLAGRQITFYMGPECMEAFTKRIGMPAQEAVNQMMAGDWNMISSVPDNLIFCAIQAGYNINGHTPPADTEIESWIASDSRGKLTILFSVLQAVVSIYNFNEKTN